MFCVAFRIRRPPPCVNYLTVYMKMLMLERAYMKMLMLEMKMLLLDMVGLPVVLSSPPRLRFFILF